MSKPQTASERWPKVCTTLAQREYRLPETEQILRAKTPFFAYTGRDWDEDLNLQYNRARWYDPASGRWLGEDPIRFEAGDVNLHRYVTNSPTNEVDPSGLDDRANPQNAKEAIDEITRNREKYEKAIRDQLEANRDFYIEGALRNLGQKDTPENRKALIDEFNRAAQIMARAYVDGVLEFLKEHSGATPSNTERRFWQSSDPFKNPVCADFQDFFFGSKTGSDKRKRTRASAYWPKFFSSADGALAGKFFMILPGQSHRYMNKNTPQHNYSMLWRRGDYPTLDPKTGQPLDSFRMKPTPGDPNQPMRSSDPKLLILDPWRRLLPEAWGASEYGKVPGHRFRDGGVPETPTNAEVINPEQTDR